MSGVQPTAPSSSPTFLTVNVAYSGRWIRVVLQDKNGPCPLLALANVLALRGDFTVPTVGPSDAATGLHSTTVEVLTNALAALALERIEARHASATASAAAQAAQQHATDDIFGSLPKLHRGMDLNVRFTAPDAYEATDELTLFDALGVRLLHGWIVSGDCDGEDVAAYVAPRGYNALITSVLADDADVGATEPSPAAAAKNGKPASGGDDADADGVKVSTDEVVTPPAAEHSVKNDDDGVGAVEEAADAPPTGEPATTATPGATTTATPAVVVDKATKDRVRSWLEATGGQLTFTGLLALRDAVAVSELVAVFRNSHFAVLTKAPDGTLLQLVTDQALALQGHAWETLEDLDGTATRFLRAVPGTARATPPSRPSPASSRRVSPPPASGTPPSATVINAVAVSAGDANPAAPVVVGHVLRRDSPPPPPGGTSSSSSSMVRTGRVVSAPGSSNSGGHPTQHAVHGRRADAGPAAPPPRATTATRKKKESSDGCVVA